MLSFMESSLFNTLKMLKTLALDIKGWLHAVLGGDDAVARVRQAYGAALHQLCVAGHACDGGIAHPRDVSVPLVHS